MKENQPGVRLIRAKPSKEKPSRNPKVPNLPSSAQATAQKLREIIDAQDERLPLAYAVLSRLCAVWARDALTDEQLQVVMNDLIGLMHELFPYGVGLPKVGEPT